jgi:starch-binding outer membrane protein SusE/F
MKLFHLTISVIALLLLSACEKDDKDVTTTITAASPLYPDNALFVDLDPPGNAVITFEWQPAKTGNYTLVFYKLVFDKENGDFSKPIYSIASAKGGIETSVALSHKELNKIASYAGIGQLQKGKVKWKVMASNGVNDNANGTARTLELQRPAGFAENPAKIYLLGDATEAGTELSKAMPFKKLSDGVFELYTSLKSGTWKLVDSTTGTPTSFVVNNNLIGNGEGGTSPAATATTYRINLDFNTSVATLTTIQSIGVWFAGYNKVTNELTYQGNGSWKATNIAIVWSTQSWGKDERYKFRITEKDGSGNITTRYMGSSKKDNNRPNNNTAASYYFLSAIDNSQWDYTYKFASESQSADVEVRFPAAADYTHQVTYH